MNKVEPIDVTSDFDVNSIHLHVSKEPDDAAIRIHLDFPDINILIPYFYSGLHKVGTVAPHHFPNFANRAFRVTSRNCDPAFDYSLWQAPPPNPYNATTADATAFTGSGMLSASFSSNISTSGAQTETEAILQTVNDYAIVTTSNSVVPPFLPVDEPDYTEAGALVSPFFFKDRTHPQTAAEATFFVQPTLSEVTLTQWVGWAVPPVVRAPVWIDRVPIEAQVPRSPIPINAGDPTLSIYPVISQPDWVTNPLTAVIFDGTPVGVEGGLDLAMRAPLSAAGIAGWSGPASAVMAAIRSSRVAMEGSALSAAQLDRLNSQQASSDSRVAATANITALRLAGEVA
jgi:hypothetical protein